MRTAPSGCGVPWHSPREERAFAPTYTSRCRGRLHRLADRDFCARHEHTERVRDAEPAVHVGAGKHDLQATVRPETKLDREAPPGEVCHAARQVRARASAQHGIPLPLAGAGRRQTARVPELRDGERELRHGLAWNPLGELREMLLDIDPVGDDSACAQRTGAGSVAADIETWA